MTNNKNNFVPGMLVSFGFRVNLCISHGRAHKSTPGPQYLHGFRVVLCYSHTIYYTECTCGICGTCGISHYVRFHKRGIRGTCNHMRFHSCGTAPRLEL